MAKIKDQRESKKASRILKRQTSFRKNTAKISKQPKIQQTPKGGKLYHLKPTVPFIQNDRVLLVGEGDFSFAHSLLKHHDIGLAQLVATTIESRSQLLEKHPQAEHYIDALLAPSAATEASEDYVEENSDSQNELWEGDAFGTICKCEVLYEIDATKLGRYKSINRRTWDRIVFNFPHVGGKSSDVNRQVRYNQELLSGFLHASLPLLASPAGTVLVTLFEGEPYTLWNIRDLARHAGFAVLRSFKFDASAYPGYQHARTLGNLVAKEGRGKKSVEVDDENHVRVGKWRGEERPSRTFEFGMKSAVTSSHLVDSGQSTRRQKGKGKRADDESSSEED